MDRGALVLPLTSQYEVLRVKTCYGTGIVYRNGAGKETWPEDLSRIRASYLKGVAIALSPSAKSRAKRGPQIVRLRNRDGDNCWYCDTEFETEDCTTIEHLCPKAHGGPNHISNLVLACESCNLEAGNKSVSEKVTLRERKRASLAQ